MGSDGDERQAAENAAARQPLGIALFPLAAVLFPGGLLSLKVFEQRYLEMAADCLRQGLPFGVCLIASGDEVGAPAAPWAVGTLAHIVEVDMPQLGIMLLSVRGGRRFRIEQRKVTPGGLLRASVTLLDEPERQALPPEYARLGAVLQQIVKRLASDQAPDASVFDDASWVSYQLAESLPLANLAKQKLLELDDPLARLQALSNYLSRQQLIAKE